MSTMMTRKTNRLLTPAEAAEFLGVKEQTLSVWRCTRRYPLPYVKVGNSVRYRESDLHTWLESRTVGSLVEG